MCKESDDFIIFMIFNERVYCESIFSLWNLVKANRIRVASTETGGDACSRSYGCHDGLEGVEDGPGVEVGEVG